MANAILGSISFFGARVASGIDYIAGYIRQDGKAVSPKAKCTLYLNLAGKNQRTGEQGKVMPLTLIGWGPRADLMARFLSKGKEISGTGELETYMGRLFDANGNVRTDSTGQQIMIPKMSVVLKDVHFGPDSDKLIQEDIAAGRRPADWNIKGSAGHNTWLQICTARKNEVWNCQSPNFGFARVVVPVGVTVNHEYYTKQRASKGQSVPQQPQQPMQGLQQQVQNVANAFAQPQQPVQPQVPGQGFMPAANAVPPVQQQAASTGLAPF